MPYAEKEWVPSRRAMRMFREEMKRARGASVRAWKKTPFASGGAGGGAASSSGGVRSKLLKPKRAADEGVEAKPKAATVSEAPATSPAPAPGGREKKRQKRLAKDADSAAAAKARRLASYAA